MVKISENWLTQILHQVPQQYAATMVGLADMKMVFSINSQFVTCQDILIDLECLRCKSLSNQASYLFQRLILKPQFKLELEMHHDFCTYRNILNQLDTKKIEASSKHCVP